MIWLVVVVRYHFSIESLTVSQKTVYRQMHKHRIVMGLVMGLIKVVTWLGKGTWKLTIRIGKHFFKLEKKDCGCP